MAAPLLLAGLGFLAERFLIFLGPIVGLGLGFLVSRAWSGRRFYAPLALMAPLLVLMFTWPAWRQALKETSWPKVSPALAAAMDRMAQETPPRAVIWAWWDEGLALNYWARRGTVNDGQGRVQWGLRSVFNGLPLAATDQRLAANFMIFFVEQGQTGLERCFQALSVDRVRAVALIKKVLAAGPSQAEKMIVAAGLADAAGSKEAKEWLAFFFPSPRRPVYLFLTARLTQTTYWWSWLGTWDPAVGQGRHPFYQFYTHLRLLDDGVTSPLIEVDLKKGLLTDAKGVMTLKQAAVRDERGLRLWRFQHERGGSFEVFAPAGCGALMDVEFSETIFNRLFLRHDFRLDHFRPASLKSPLYQLWEVRGDGTPEARKAP